MVVDVDLNMIREPSDYYRRQGFRNYREPVVVTFKKIEKPKKVKNNNRM